MSDNRQFQSQFRPRSFSYFLFENFDANSASCDPLNPRSFLNHSIDEILSWVSDTPAEKRTRTFATEKFGAERISMLIDGGILREDGDVIFFDTPIFLSEDCEPLSDFFSDAAERFVNGIYAEKARLYALADTLKNGFSPRENLYHIICGKCFDGLFLDKLSATGVLSNGRMHRSKLDYLAVIYEESPDLRHFSDNLLCSFNRVANDSCALQSFGDANGNRLDCYRYFRLREKDADSLPPEYDVVKKYSSELSGEDLLCGMREFLRGNAVNENVLRALEIFGYIKDGKVCVPVFESRHTETIQNIESLLETILLDPISELLRNLSSLDITATRHGVSEKEIANECWHILFGSMNELLVNSGTVAEPTHKITEGRYLKSVEIYE